MIFCSGKVYYDLLEERESRDSSDVHLLRVEQLYPFPAEELAGLLEPYKHCRLVWCQEEPRNMGAWDFVRERISEVAGAVGCEHPEPGYVGRDASASPATGLHSRHLSQQAKLVDAALTV